MKLLSAIVFSLGVPVLPGQEPSGVPVKPLAEASANLPGVNQSITDGLVRLNKEGEVVLAAAGAEYTLEGGDQLRQKTEQGIPLHIKVSRVRGHGTHYLEVESYTARSVGRWLETMGDEYLTSKIESKQRIYQQALFLRRKIQENLSEPAANQDWKGLDDEYGKLGTLVREAQLDEPNPGLRSELAIFQSNLQQERKTFLSNKLTDQATAGPAEEYVEKELPAVEKRFYRMNDNYRPEIYPLIFAQSSACVAIVRKGESLPLGSGALIGRNLVLTCKHNIAENYADDFTTTQYRVWMDFEERVISKKRLTKTVFLAKEVYRSPTLDFTLLEIMKKVDEEAAEGTHPASGFDLFSKLLDMLPESSGSRTLLPLNGDPVPRWTPIFVVGHPNGSARIVHDSSWVLFPHQLLNKEERGKIEAEISEDYRYLESAPDSSEASEEAARKARRFMNRVYGEAKPDPKTVYRLSKNGDDYIGIESDTFEGDSGAPVMLRENGSIIGILFKGLGDMGQDPKTPDRRPAMRLIPGADNHERVLPMNLIIKELDSQQIYPNWRNGVTFSD